jgi:hypothetical protein
MNQVLDLQRAPARRGVISFLAMPFRSSIGALIAGAMLLGACGGGDNTALSTDSAAVTASGEADRADAATASGDSTADGSTRAQALASSPAAAPPANATWTRCAGEGGVCTVPASVTVRYGANGSYLYQTVTGSVACNNSAWGDPLFGAVKACDYTTTAATSSGGGWVDCASEGGVCSFSGTRNVRYGANGTYFFKTATGQIACNNGAWGDPIFGVAKSCAYENSSTAPTGGGAGWSACATEGGVCNFSGTRNVRYGANGSYLFKTITGSIACNNYAWGSDPIVGIAKSCEVDGGGTAPAPTPAPTPTPTPTPTPAPTPSPSPLSGPGPLDVSRPTTVVGNGSASSCTETALRAAVATGGVVTFNCGGATTTIALGQPLVAPIDRDTTIDGADRIVLDGQGSTQILRAFRGDFRTSDRVLAVQRLQMIRGRDVGTGYVGRNGTSTCAWGYKEGGGGAIFTRDMNLRIWGVTFDGNRGPEIGPDVAGGAIYVFGAKQLIVNNSIFRNNSASNGGAIGLLQVGTEIHNTVFENNRATGQLANFGGASGCPVFNHAEQGGAGGLGGAFYSDGGFATNDLFSKVRMTGNSANNLGGAVFRSAYWGAGGAKQTITWESSVFERNSTPLGGGGAAYVNNSLFVLRGTQFNGNAAGASDGGALKITGATVQASDLSVTNNSANWGGGIAHWGGGPEGVGSAVRITYSNNLPQDVVGDFPR